jgi:hypothetical protein
VIDRAISQRGAMLVAATCIFFSPARHLTRFGSDELLPHRSNEHAKFFWDRWRSLSRRSASARSSALAIITF